MAYMLTYARCGRPILASSAPEKTIVESICKEMETLKATAHDYNTYDFCSLFFFCFLFFILFFFLFFFVCLVICFLLLEIMF
jgi:hypothetical protein